MVPYIEDSQEAIEQWLADEGQFWIRLFDSEDPVFKRILCIVVDGAHRLHVCSEKLILRMRAVFARPTISIAEQTSLGHDQNRVTTEGHVKQSDADNMFSFVQLVVDRNISQVRELFVFRLGMRGTGLRLFL